MADPQVTAPIVVPASAAQAQIDSAVRTILITVGGSLAAKGAIDKNLVEPIIALLLILGPYAWAWASNARKHARAVVMAKALDDTIAQVKS